MGDPKDLVQDGGVKSEQVSKGMDSGSCRKSCSWPKGQGRDSERTLEFVSWWEHGCSASSSSLLSSPLGPFSRSFLEPSFESYHMTPAPEAQLECVPKLDKPWWQLSETCFTHTQVSVYWPPGYPGAQLTPTELLGDLGLDQQSLCHSLLANPILVLPRVAPSIGFSGAQCSSQFMLAAGISPRATDPVPWHLCRRLD